MCWGPILALGASLPPQGASQMLLHPADAESAQVSILWRNQSTPGAGRLSELLVTQGLSIARQRFPERSTSATHQLPSCSLNSHIPPFTISRRKMSGGHPVNDFQEHGPPAQPHSTQHQVFCPQRSHSQAILPTLR